MGFKNRNQHWLASALALLIGASGFFGVAQAAYPEQKPIQLVVPYPAGGGSDVIARIVSTPLGQALAQTVVVENIGGATGLLGVKRVLGAAPDGYTVLQGSANDIILTPLLNRSAGYKAEDFKLVQPLSRSIVVLLVRNDLGVETIDQFVELAKKSGSNPLTYGSVGIGSQYHLMGEKLAKRVRGHVLHAPYKGGAPALQDLAGGQLDFAILPYQTSMREMEKQGRLKIIAAFSKVSEMPATMSGVPSVENSKSVPDFLYSVGSGYYVRKDVPDAVTEKIRSALWKVMENPGVRKALEDSGRAVMPRLSAPEARAFQHDETRRYTEMAQGFSLP